MVVVDGANHSQKDDVEGNRGSLMKDGAEAFVLFLPGAKLVLRSSVLTVLDLEVDVMLENAENLGRCCLGKVDPQMAGSAAEVLQVSLRCPLPLLRTHPPSLLAGCFLFSWRWEQPVRHPDGLVNLFLSEKRVGMSHFGMILASAVT